MIPDDGSAIHTIVFITPSRQPAPKTRKRAKQWTCPDPECGRTLATDELLDFENGWSLVDQGRWWVKGICPHCFSRVEFTKSGSRMLVTLPVAPTPKPSSGLFRVPRKTVIRKRGEMPYGHPKA